MSLRKSHATIIVAFCGASLAAQAPQPPDIAAAANALTLRGIGPAIMGGRIADIEVHPTDRSTWYVAVGSGGVWKTSNAGTTFTPVSTGRPPLTASALQRLRLYHASHGLTESRFYAMVLLIGIGAMLFWLAAKRGEQLTSTPLLSQRLTLLGTLMQAIAFPASG